VHLRMVLGLPAGARPASSLRWGRAGVCRQAPCPAAPGAPSPLRVCAVASAPCATRFGWGRTEPGCSDRRAAGRDAAAPSRAVCLRLCSNRVAFLKVKPAQGFNREKVENSWEQVVVSPGLNYVCTALVRTT